jgi:arabinan endo-1,5-alpha-L-arabinosidase
MHDPAIVFDGEKYYAFSTDVTNVGLHYRCSPNVTAFAECGVIFPNGVPAWALKYVPAATNIWAPDVSFFNNRYNVYYAVSSFGSEVSVIGLVTTTSLANPVWQDQGLVWNSSTSSGYNAIDPAYIYDPVNDKHYISLGSFWTGIKLLEIDPTTGKPFSQSAPVTALAERPPPDALEGSFIIYKPEYQYFYLFASFDVCCRGVKSNYTVHVGRSKSVTGPYSDEAGVPMLQGGGTNLTHAPAFGWAAGGGQSIERISNNMMVAHAYDGVTGDPYLQVIAITWDDASQWPQLLP